MGCPSGNCRLPLSPANRATDQLVFWNGQGGQTWVARQEHTDIILARVLEALLGPAARRRAGTRRRLRQRASNSGRGP
jgi:hypothetical protein